MLGCFFFGGYDSGNAYASFYSFGDGLRCVGGNVYRIEVLSADGSGCALSTAFLGALANTGGDTYYQYWYRNPTGSPCGSNFNLSNALQVLWQ